MRRFNIIVETLRRDYLEFVQILAPILFLASIFGPVGLFRMGTRFDIDAYPPSIEEWIVSFIGMLYAAASPFLLLTSLVLFYAGFFGSRLVRENNR